MILAVRMDYLRQLKLLWGSVEHPFLQIIHVWPCRGFFVRVIIDSKNAGLSDESLRRECIDRCVSTEFVTRALFDPVQFPINLVHAYHLELLQIS